MEEVVLPNIKDMYQFIKNNKDYINVVRCYQDSSRDKLKKASSTKRTNYLDECIKMSYSPGPANQANLQEQWTKKSKIECKRSQKATFLDFLTKHQKKKDFPSPNKYKIEEHWPKKSDKPKIMSERSNFVDTARYEADKLPGPGSYNLVNYIKVPKKQNKWSPHKPIIEKQQKVADMATYSPCPLQYNTFQRMKKQASHPILNTKLQKIQKSAKQNLLPGPGTYAVINNWGPKSKLKRSEFSLNSLSFAQPPKVYYN